MDMSEMVKHVRAHALRHYEENGWDIIFECYDPDELVELIGDAATPEQAIEKVGETAKRLDDHRKDIESTAF